MGLRQVPAMEEAARAARQAAWEAHHLSRDMHDERNRGLMWLAGSAVVALWAAGALTSAAGGA